MISAVWFRRDLRLEDQTALHHALRSGNPVLPVFIFDTNILEELPEVDPRVSFIHQQLEKLNNELESYGSSMLVLQGDPIEVWSKLILDYPIGGVFVNRDYEPYSIARDAKIDAILRKNDIPFRAFKDQVIYEGSEIMKADGNPYSVYTPYKNKWLSLYQEQRSQLLPQTNTNSYFQIKNPFPPLSDIGFAKSAIKVRDYNLDHLDRYEDLRDLPAEDATSYLSVHLRFGTVSIRELVQKLKPVHSVFLGELIWREFFMQILYHYPEVVNRNYRRKYDGIEWRNNEEEYFRWCKGMTGYPMVDAGMRQLNETGYMHNRVRMVTAGFLCKHLLIDWRWGEAYFAEKLLDYELSSNNGNWQWAAGTGCDAAPYFRVFNPSIQMKKFDPRHLYVKRWITEYLTADYPDQMIEHATARDRSLEVYRKTLLTR